MPNWCTNKVTIKSSDKETMDKFLKAGKPNKKENRIDGCKYSFGSWRPMPRTFRQYDTTNHPNGEHLVVGEPLHWGTDSPIVTEELINKFKTATAYQKKKYGVVGWYDWASRIGYGTKWDAGFDVSRVSDTECYIDYVDTAWSAPLEFFEFISKKFSLYIEMLSHYEDNDNRLFLIEEGQTTMEDPNDLRAKMINVFYEKAKFSGITERQIDNFFYNDYWNCTYNESENWDMLCELVENDNLE